MKNWNLSHWSVNLNWKFSKLHWIYKCFASFYGHQFLPCKKQKKKKKSSRSRFQKIRSLDLCDANQMYIYFKRIQKCLYSQHARQDKVFRFGLEILWRLCHFFFKYTSYTQDHSFVGFSWGVVDGGKKKIVVIAKENHLPLLQVKHLIAPLFSLSYLHPS